MWQGQVGGGLGGEYGVHTVGDWIWVGELDVYVGWVALADGIISTMYWIEGAAPGFLFGRGSCTLYLPIIH